MTEGSESDNTNRIIKRGIFFVIWFVILLFYFSSFSSSNLLSLFYSGLLIVPIRFFGDKKVKTINIKTDIKSMFIRIGNCRPKYKMRTIISGVLFLLCFLPSLSYIIGNIKENRTETAKQEAYNNAPSPIIEILSQSGNLGSITGYTLVYRTKYATSIVIGNKTFSGNDKENSVNFSLDGVGKSSLNILILARNEYKSTEMPISITRNKTAEEINIENEEKIKAEKERIAYELSLVVFDIPSLIGKSFDKVKSYFGPELTSDFSEPTRLQLEMGTDERDNSVVKNGYTLMITYNVRTRKVIDFFLDGSNKNALMQIGNLKADAKNYYIEEVEALSYPGQITGIKIIKK